MDRRLLFLISANVVIWPSALFGVIEKMRHPTLNDWGIFFLHPWFFSATTAAGLLFWWLGSRRG